jgi:Glycosyltransferases involved in cell wall biogenesis
MTAPEISIILPVHNSGRYIRKTIDSLLAQSFRNFELIIINDGSTDDSETIIQSYTDPRIAYYANDGNKGLIFTLNRGIFMARGKYIARMDADDICLPERLELQKLWLDEHTDASMVACTIQFIDEQDAPAGAWPLDRSTITRQAIHKTLPKENCIAHPSIMGRTGVFKAYWYAENQKNTEDYDLWLRLAADGHIIDKINRDLLLYRVHQQSVTQAHLRKGNMFLKLYHCKRRFVWQRIRSGKFNGFVARVMATMAYDLGVALFKIIKR